MAIDEPVYTDWLHQQVRVKPDHLIVHNLSAERRNRLRGHCQFKWRGGLSGFGARALQAHAGAV